MNFYNRWVLPPILDLFMRQTQLEKYRREVVAAASGRVLEVGVGSGLNFPLYGKQVETVIGIDPLPPTRPALEAKCGKCKAKVFAGHPEDVATEIFDRQIARSAIPVHVDVWASDHA